MQPELGPGHDFAKRLSTMEYQIANLNTRDGLQNASIGAGGLLVKGGQIHVTSGGSILVDGSGTITLPTGAFSSGSVTTTALTVNGSSNLVGSLTVGAVSSGAINSTGDVSAANARLSGGTLYSPYAYSNPVTTSYLAAYINGPDGRFGATPSAQRFKQDVTPKTYTLEQANLIQVVNYRLIAAVAELGDKAAVEVGVIAEQLIAAGLSEFVAFDPESGLPLSVHYERLVVVAFGALRDVASQLSALEGRLSAAGIA